MQQVLHLRPIPTHEEPTTEHSLRWDLLLINRKPDARAVYSAFSPHLAGMDLWVSLLISVPRARGDAREGATAPSFPFECDQPANGIERQTSLYVHPVGKPQDKGPRMAQQRMTVEGRRTGYLVEVPPRGAGIALDLPVVQSFGHTGWQR